MFNSDAFSLTNSEEFQMYHEAFASLNDSRPQPNLGTTGKWERNLKIYSLAFRDEQNQQPVRGDSIIMSSEVLDELSKKKRTIFKIIIINIHL